MSYYKDTIRTCCDALFDYCDGAITQKEFEDMVNSTRKDSQLELPIALNKDTLNGIEQTKEDK